MGVILQDKEAGVYPCEIHPSAPMFAGRRLVWPPGRKVYVGKAYVVVEVPYYIPAVATWRAPQ
eukprot:11198664-Lingulodinium_polyedra.AAC.1